MKTTDSANKLINTLFCTQLHTSKCGLTETCTLPTATAMG